MADKRENKFDAPSLLSVVAPKVRSTHELYPSSSLEGGPVVPGIHADSPADFAGAGDTDGPLPKSSGTHAAEFVLPTSRPD